METLEFEKNRYKVAAYCPCGKSNRDGKFAPFKGFSKFGFCHSCDKSFYDDSDVVKQYHKPPPTPPTLFLKRELVDKSITGSNNFLTYLHSIFDDTTVQQLVEAYRIGTTKYFSQGTVFWFIDLHGNVRSGKAMGYHTNGHRRKTPPQVNWVHSILKLQNFKYSACLYGLHLLKTASKQRVAIVESEKTAIIASAYLPEFTWLATGGKQNFRRGLFECIKDREIVLFADKGCYDVWKQVAEKELKGFKWSISKWIEGTDAAEGADIADLLTKEPPRNQKQLNNNSITTQKQRRNNVETAENQDYIIVSKSGTNKISKPNPITQKPTQSDWDANEFKEISKTHKSNTSDLRDAWGVSDILTILEGKTLPETLILTSGEVITNVRHMVKTHSAIVKAQNGKTAYLPYLNRLKQIAQITIE